MTMSMVRIFLLAAMIAVAAPSAMAQIPAGGSTTFKDDGPTPPAPPPPPAAPAVKDNPRTDKPMGDATKYYQKKDFVTTGDHHDMTYYWRQPDKLERDATYPLVIILHDERGMADAGKYIISPDIQGANPSFIAIPMIGGKKIWAFPTDYPEDPALANKYKNSPQALPDVKDLIDDIRKNFPVDDKRIYVVGCGDGGFGAMGAVYNNPTEFAAAIAAAGGWAQQQTGKIANSKTPIYMINGSDDKVASQYLASVAAFDIQKLKGKISFLPVPGATHDCSDQRFYMKPLWKWMYAQHRQ